MSEIAACQRCASTELKMPGFSDGLVPETDNLAEWVCSNCGLRATPLLFDDKSAYLAFRNQQAPRDERD